MATKFEILFISSLFQGEDEMPMFSFDNTSNPGLDSLATLGAVGGGGGGGLNSESSNKKINEESQKPQNVVAVPKNIQRNIISRERDRKVRRGAEKPRNMMNEVMEVNPLGELSYDSFVVSMRARV